MAACSRRGGADGAGGREEGDRGAGAGGERRGAAQGSQVDFLFEKLSSFFHRISQHGLRRDEEGKQSDCN